MAKNLRLTTFDEVDLADPFFDSLKEQYTEFPVWFAKKAAAKEQVYVIDGVKGKLRGFVYLKIEEGAIDDIDPPLPPARRLKVGTLKINARGTKLGERVIKKMFDHAISSEVKEIYVTVFDSHAKLINLFKRYGFIEVGSKTTPNGTEVVLLRDLDVLSGDAVADYPFMHCEDQNVYLLAIYPEYHTKLFPDSILHNESPNIVEDLSFTNTIHKVYIAKLALTRLKPGDVVVIYRTTDREGQARFRSVVTSVCVVEEVKARRDFNSVDEFLAFAAPHSVFSEQELRDMFAGPDRLYAVRMLYNAAFRKRTIRDTLLDVVGISEQPRWDLRKLTWDQFQHIAELGELPSRLLVD